LIKRCVWKFSPFSECSASHSWNIGLNQDIGFITKPNYSIYISGLMLGLIFIKDCKIKTLRRANLSIVAAKYQLLKMQEDVADICKCFLARYFLTRKI
jgi:outer membrane protein